MAEQKFNPQSKGGDFNKPRAPEAKPAAPAPAPAVGGQSLSGLTEQQAQEFHEQFKVTYTAFVAVAAGAHLLVLVAKPWF